MVAPDSVCRVTYRVELELQGLIEDTAQLKAEIVVVKSLQAFLQP